MFLSLADKGCCCCVTEAERSCAYTLSSLCERLSLSFFPVGGPNRSMEMMLQELGLSQIWCLASTVIVFTSFMYMKQNCFDKN